jgi:predicted restriction endonuclease
MSRTDNHLQEPIIETFSQVQKQVSQFKGMGAKVTLVPTFCKYQFDTSESVQLHLSCI